MCPQLSCFAGYKNVGLRFDPVSGDPTEGTQGTAAWVPAACGDTPFDHETWLEVNLPWVAQSDAVLWLPGRSRGANREVEYAEELGIPVVYCIFDLDAATEEPRPTKDDVNENFVTGSVRDTRVGKGRFDLLPPTAIRRLAEHFETGAKKYGDRNWQKGQPLQRYIDSALRHIFCHQGGRQDEDHIIAAAWNLLAHSETSQWISDGTLPATLDDFPYSVEERTP